MDDRVRVSCWVAMVDERDASAGWIESGNSDLALVWYCAARRREIASSGGISGMGVFEGQVFPAPDDWDQDR